VTAAMIGVMGVHSPHETEHRLSHRRANDRIRYRPPSLLRWLQEEYALESPPRLHNHALAEDGDPVMNGEAAGWLGFHQGEDGGRPNDWRALACRTDQDGKYLTPMRCAIARVGDPNEGRFLGALASNVLHPVDVSRQFGVPDWCRGDVISAGLERLWSNYLSGPIPDRRPSESQSIAEAVPI